MLISRFWFGIFPFFFLLILSQWICIDGRGFIGRRGRNVVRMGNREVSERCIIRDSHRWLIADKCAERPPGHSAPVPTNGASITTTPQQQQQQQQHRPNYTHFDSIAIEYDHPSDQPETDINVEWFGMEKKIVSTTRSDVFFFFCVIFFFFSFLES